MGLETELVQPLRSLVPARALPVLVRRRVDRLWKDPAYRAAQVAEMEFLLAHTDRAREIPALARAHAEQMTLRSYLRWHPGRITRQPVRDVAPLTGRRDPERPLILSFMHHHRYDGMFASLARAGVACDIVTIPDALAPDAPAYIKQHIRVVRRGGRVVPTTGGTAALVERMVPGATLAIASDVPGRTPVEFLGRKVLGSFGAARIAVLTDSPVVVVTSHRDGDGSYLQVHEPLDPRSFEGAAGLLDAILALHGEAVLAWPEALDSPRSRWGPFDG